MAEPDSPAAQPGSQLPAVGGHRLLRWGAWILLGLYFCLCVTLWVQRYWEPDWDSSLYLLTARSLATGAGYEYLGEPFTLRPPGFSWLLSLFFQDGTVDVVLLNRLVMASVGLGVVTLYMALRRRLGEGLALAVALLTASSPLYPEWSTRVLSDFPFLVCLFLGFALIEGPPGRGWLATLSGSLALVAAYYLRSAAVLLVPALLVSEFLRRRQVKTAAGRARAWLPPLLLVALALPWVQHSREVAASAPGPSEQLLLHDYQTATFRAEPGDPTSALVTPADLLERAATNGPRILDHALGHGTSIPFRVLVLLLGMAGWILAVRRGPSGLDGFALLYTLLLLFYFTNDARLALPLVPFLYLYCLTSLAALASRLARPRAAAWALALVVALVGGANLLAWPPGALSGEARRRAEPPPGETLDVYRTADWLRDNTPADARLLTGNAPIYSWLSDRVAYSWRFRRDDNMLDRYAVDYAVFDASFPEPELQAIVAKQAAERMAIGPPDAPVPGAVYRFDP